MVPTHFTGWADTQQAVAVVVVMDATYGEQDVDSAPASARDGCAFVACERAPRGRWRIESTDLPDAPLAVITNLLG
jgi:hypothetical protein